MTDLEKALEEKGDDGEEIRAALQKAQIDIDGTMRRIMEKYELRVDETESLNDAIIEVLLGNKRVIDFFDALEDMLDMPKVQANHLARDIEKYIFGPARKHLSALQQHTTEQHWVRGSEGA